MREISCVNKNLVQVICRQGGGFGATDLERGLSELFLRWSIMVCSLPFSILYLCTQPQISKSASNNISLFGLCTNTTTHNKGCRLPLLNVIYFFYHDYVFLLLPRSTPKWTNFGIIR